MLNFSESRMSLVFSKYTGVKPRKFPTNHHLTIFFESILVIFTACECAEYSHLCKKLGVPFIGALRIEVGMTKRMILQLKIYFTQVSSSRQSCCFPSTLLPIWNHKNWCGFYRNKFSARQAYQLWSRNPNIIIFTKNWKSSFSVYGFWDFWSRTVNFVAWEVIRLVQFSLPFQMRRCSKNRS